MQFQWLNPWYQPPSGQDTPDRLNQPASTQNGHRPSPPLEHATLSASARDNNFLITRAHDGDVSVDAPEPMQGGGPLPLYAQQAVPPNPASPEAVPSAICTPSDGRENTMRRQRSDGEPEQATPVESNQKDEAEASFGPDDTQGNADPREVQTVDALNELLHRHEKVVQNHINLSERVEDMRRARTEVRLKEASLISRVKELLEGGGVMSAAELDIMLNALQSARQEQERQEQACDETVDNLVDQGFGIGQMGHHFFARGSRDETAIARLAASIDYRPNQLGEATYEAASDSNRSNYSPRTVQYLSLVGDHELLEERLEELQIDKGHLESELFHLSMSRVERGDGTAETITDLETDIQGLQKEIQATTDSLRDTRERLQQYEQALEMGSPTNEPSSDVQSSTPAFDPLPPFNSIAVPDESSTHPLIFDPEGLDPRIAPFQQWSAHPGADRDSSGFINSWQLHHLRSSPEQQQIYRRVAEEHPVLLSEHELPRRIVETWSTLTLGVDSVSVAVPPSPNSRRSSIHSTRGNETRQDASQPISTPPPGIRRNASLLNMTTTTSESRAGHLSAAF